MEETWSSNLSMTAIKLLNISIYNPPPFQGEKISALYWAFLVLIRHFGVDLRNHAEG